jgi:hypothetical protein
MRKMYLSTYGKENRVLTFREGKKRKNYAWGIMALAKG